MVGKQNDIGKLIRERRKEKGLTLVELGEIIGVANGTISKWERGQIKNIRRDKIQALCDVLGIPPYTFISGTYKDEDVKKISKEEFKSEVSALIYRCSELNSHEKSLLRTVIKNIIR